MKTYTEQFDEWFEAEKQKGLVDIKFFIGELKKDSSVEILAREALEVVLRSKKMACAQPDF
jgi:hypothetical protein